MPVVIGSPHEVEAPSQPDGAQPSLNWTPAHTLSVLLAALLALEALGGLLVPGVYHDSASWAAQARGVNMVDLLVTVPVLLLAVWLDWRGSARAVLVWTGVLGYALYNATIFAFDTAFNRFFLIYVAVLALAVFGLIAVVRSIDAVRFATRFTRSAPRRVISGYLLLVGALFLLAWLKDIIPAMLIDTTPISVVQAQIPTNPVYVLDLAFLIPLHVTTAVWLLRRRASGYLLAGALLVLNTLLGLSIISGTLFQVAADPSASLAILPVFVAVAVASLLLALSYFRSMHDDARPSS